MTDKKEEPKRTISREAFNKAMEEARRLVSIGVTTGIKLITPAKPKTHAPPEKSHDTGKGKSGK